MSTPTGLVNIGNSCYFNSLVQGLLSCDYFVEYIKINQETDEIAKAFLQIYYGNTKSVSDLLTLATKKFGGPALIKSGQQEDAHETFMILIDNMDKKVSQLFNVRHRAFIKCGECNKLTKRETEEEQPTELFLEHNINDKFNIISSMEIMPDYKCEYCMTSGKCILAKQLCRISPICMIIVKNYQKQHTTPDLPITFNINDLSGNPMPYDVKSTIEHFGSMSGGHYIAKVKRGEHTAIANDSSISTISSIDITQNTYVVLYERRK
jgi:ubiquitin C-terminal hydrolase